MKCNLHIRIIEATGLPKMDLFGKCDPYVVLQYNNDRVISQTKVIKKTYKPVWNEDFHFPVVSQMDDSIKFFLKDEDKGKSDDPISRLIIELKTLTLNQVTDKWYDCIPVKGVKKGGRLRLKVHLAEEGAVAFVEGAPANSGQTTKIIGALGSSMQSINTGIMGIVRQQQTAANSQPAPQQQPAAPAPQAPAASIPPQYPAMDQNPSTVTASQPQFQPPPMNQGGVPPQSSSQLNSNPYANLQPNTPPPSNLQYQQPAQFNSCSSPQPQYAQYSYQTQYNPPQGQYYGQQPSQFNVPQGYGQQPQASMYQSSYGQYPNQYQQSNPMMGALPTGTTYNQGGYRY